MVYLRGKKYYIDLYDLRTIEECINYYWSLKDGFTKEKDSYFSKYSDEKFQQETNKCLNLMLFSIKGERYRHKKETIKKWMDKDRRTQEIYDTPPPQNIQCRACGSPTTITHKDLHDSYEPNVRMVFMFKCTKCEKVQVLYEDGTEWKYDPPKCPNCKHPLKTDLKIDGEISTFTSTCAKCGYKDVDIDDHAKFKQEQEAKDKRNKELLEKYRDDFCLSDKDGQEYLEYAETLKYASEVKEEEIRKCDDSAYQRSTLLKKLSIVELEKLLSEKLEKENYIKLSLDKPEIGQFVIVSFSIQDQDSARKKYDSINNFQKIIKHTLEDTNWRLMSEGVSYRLGYITGRLKGAENEEDLLELVGKKKEKKPSKEDEEKRLKYAGDNMVQFAKLMGQMEGIERTRKRRLEQEPDGFFLNDGGEGYTCGICSESISGDRTWWDLHGIRCPDCQRNLKAGVVPLEIFEDDYGYDVEIKSWNFRDGYGVHPSSVKRLRREGLLKGIDLKRVDGTVYHTIYLVSENQEFLKKYPQKSLHTKTTIMSGDGKNVKNKVENK